MDDKLLLSILLAAAGFFVALQGLRFLVSVLQLRRLRFRPSASYEQIAREAVPQDQRILLDSAADALVALGFVYQQTWQADSMAVFAEPELRYFDLYFHAEQGAFAQVLISEAPEPGRVVNCVFSTSTADARYLTLNRCLHLHFPYPPGWHAADAQADSLAAVWAFHLQRLPAAPRLTEQTEASHFAAQESEMLGHWQSIGWLVPVREAWRLTALGAWRFVRQVLAGNRRIAQLPALQNPESTDIRILADRLAWAAQERSLRAMAAPLREKYLWFFISGAFGLGAFAWLTSWHSAGLLMAVLLFHEFGHALAMRFLGYQQLGVLVLPFLGAVATGRKDDAGPWQRLLVLLAGPLPGLLLAALLIGLGYARSGEPAWLIELLVMLVLLNWFNLLPLTPLDGGQIVDTFVFARRPRLRFGFSLLSTVGLVLVGYYLESPFLAGAGILLGVAVPATWRAIALQRGLPQGLDAEAALTAALHKIHAGDAVCRPCAQRMQQVRGLLPVLRARAPRWSESLGGLAIYLAVFALPVFLAVSLPAFGQFFSRHVAPESAASHDQAEPPNWSAQLAATSQPMARWQVLFSAGGWFEEDFQDEKAQARYREALAELAALPGDEPEARLPRLDTRIALARLEEDSALRQAAYLALLPELRQLLSAERSRLADALEGLAWLQPWHAPQQAAYLEEAIAVRGALVGQSPDYNLGQDRVELARLYDAQGRSAEAEALLQANVSGAGPEFAYFRPPYVWFLLAHGRATEALAALPAQDVPGLEIADARFWALRQAGDTSAAQAVLTGQLTQARQRKRPNEDAVMRLLLDLVVVHVRDPAREAQWLAEAAHQREKLGKDFRYLRSSIRDEAASANWEALRGQARLAVLDRLPGAEQDRRDEEARKHQCGR